MSAITQTNTREPPHDPSRPTAHDLSRLSVLRERRMLTKVQVAARMGCSERSLERLVKTGRFPVPRRFGRAVVWFEAAVEQVLGLAEQEQLDWRSEATGVVAETPQGLPEPSGVLVDSLIPDARELASPVAPQPARKTRKAPGSSERRKPTGVSAEDFGALRQMFNMPAI